MSQRFTSRRITRVSRFGALMAAVSTMGLTHGALAQDAAAPDTQAPAANAEAAKGTATDADAAAQGAKTAASTTGDAASTTGDAAETDAATGLTLPAEPGQVPAAPTQPAGTDEAAIRAAVRAEVEAAMAAAKKDAAPALSTADALKQWEEERWVAQVKPHLSFIELDGYLRMRGDFFHQMDLGTYDPGAGRGTSQFAPPTLYRPYDGQTDANGNATCVDGTAQNGTPCLPNASDTKTVESINMRFRVDPTLNISEDIRIKGQVDFLDNFVLGSRPLGADGNNVDMLALTTGQAAIGDAMSVRRLYGEVDTPIGQLQFGRMPHHFGLGIWANSGDGLDDDFGDNLDGVRLTTTALGLEITPMYAVMSSGAIGRGGGLGNAGDGNNTFSMFEQGQRHNLDPRDDVHALLLRIENQRDEDKAQKTLAEGGFVFDYGVLGEYQTQSYDNPTLGGSQTGTTNMSAAYVRRDANIGTVSGYGRLRAGAFEMEAEVVGRFGQIGNASLLAGLDSTDPNLGNRPLWLMQGGAAVETRYAVLQNKLVFGLNGGWASGDDAPGFGLRTGLNNNGTADGRQYGSCLETAGDGSCSRVDDNVTNFVFDRDYHVDQMLFREAIGSVTDAFYVKPHVAYYLTPDFGLKGDLIASFAQFASSTPAATVPGANPLGVELDASVFHRTADGFYVVGQYGFLYPLTGMSHGPDQAGDDTSWSIAEQFRTAQPAHTMQIHLGIDF